MELGYLLFTLMCPLSMVALVAWWVWSMRRSSSTGQAPRRSATEQGEITRMRAQLDQLDIQARDRKAPANP